MSTDGWVYADGSPMPYGRVVTGVSKVQALVVKLDEEGEQQVRQIIREELASMLDELRAKP